MISSHFEHMVTTLLPAEEFCPFRRADLKHLPQRTAERFLLQAEQALGEPWTQPSLADWLESPACYDQKRAQNRRMLARLCLGEAVAQQRRFLGAAAEGIFLLLREPDWNRAGRRRVPAFSSAPDTFAAQTAELLAWALLLLGRDLEEQAIGLRESVLDACERRVLCHLDEPACCEAALRDTNAPVFARAMSGACLLMPQDESVRWLRLKNALRVADRCAVGGYLQSAWEKGGLEAWLEGACAIADTVLLTDLACSGESGLRTDASLTAEMRLPALLHISGLYFADEKSKMSPAIHGEDLYRIGATFDDDALCSLGALLDQRVQARYEDENLSLLQYRPQESIVSCMLNALWRASLEQDGGAREESELSRVASLHFCAARPHAGNGFYAALMGGSPVLFLDGAPLLGLGDVRSMPEIDGIAPVRVSCRDESMRQDGFPTISMDISPCFPAEASLSSWQRTIMLTNHAQTVRMLDVFDFAGARHACSVRFLCAEEPVPAVGAPRARIGNAHLEWEGPARARIEETPQGEHILVLEKEESCAGGCWTYTFTRAQD